jgi:minor extracellular serine protease Vpr
VKKLLAVQATTAIAVALAFAAAAGAVVGGSSGTTDGAPATTGIDTGSAIVQLQSDPLSTSAKTKPAKGKKIDFNSTTVKSYRAQLSAQRNDFKQWLQQNAPGAKVVGQYDISLNAVAVRLNGAALQTVASAPMVASAQYESLYQPAAASQSTSGAGDPDLALIGAGNPNAGAGVKVAVVDTGIDVTQPCFSDAGYPAQQQLGNPNFTNNKVIVAKVFNNKLQSNGFTAEAVQEHGTHVAGTIACDYGLTNPFTNVDGVTVPYGVTGVAPAALLGSYNVFPGDVTNARSEDILNALDAAYEDGFDVANLSLGGNAHGVQDLLTTAIDDLDQANMVVAVAAGNDGPGPYTVSSPGSAARALTAGASTVPHFIGAPLTVGSISRGVASGSFATVSSDLTAPFVAVTSGGSLSTACSTLPAGSLTGAIALISRGTCTFSAKIRNAQDAGAIAAIVVNNVAGDPVSMGLGGIPNEPTIPAYMASLADRSVLTAASGQSATIGAVKQYFQSANANIMAGFSSQGPTDVDFRVKPDVVAPGVNVLSSIPHTFCAAPPCWAFFQGTSMATPHLAGTAAAVLSTHPDWSAASVRSAIVNTATRGTLTSYTNGTSVVTNPNIVGAGIENVAAANAASVSLDPVSVSFGSVPSGSAQTKTATVSLSSLKGSGSYTVAVDSANRSGVSFGATLSGSTVTVTMTEDRRASGGDYYATLHVFGGGGEVAHAVVYTFVK